MSPKTDNIFILQITTLGYEPSPGKLFVKMHGQSDDRKKGVQQFVDSQAQHFMIYWFSTIFFLKLLFTWIWWIYFSFPGDI